MSPFTIVPDVLRCWSISGGLGCGVITIEPSSLCVALGDTKDVSLGTDPNLGDCIGSFPGGYATGDGLFLPSLLLAEDGCLSKLQVDKLLGVSSGTVNAAGALVFLKPL
jgi:hypothetical protein